MELKRDTIVLDNQYQETLLEQKIVLKRAS
jgi:hypothetical protein